MNTRQKSYAGQIVARIAELRRREDAATSAPQRAALGHMLELWRLELSLIEREESTPVPGTGVRTAIGVDSRTSAALGAILAIHAELDELVSRDVSGSTTGTSLRARRVNHLLIDLRHARRLLTSVEMSDD